MPTDLPTCVRPGCCNRVNSRESKYCSQACFHMCLKHSRHVVQYVPTPEEIRRETERIRAGWSAQDEAKRFWCSERPTWDVPVIDYLGSVE